jgi:hypothetical protein
MNNTKVFQVEHIRNTRAVSTRLGSLFVVTDIESGSLGVFRMEHVDHSTCPVYNKLVALKTT